MSANVWNEQVEKGLIKEILKSVTYYSEENNGEIYLPSKSVFVRKPEEIFKVETFPCVSIASLFFSHNRDRYNPLPQVVSIDKQSKTAVLEDSAVPFSLFYQIDFWSLYQSHRNSMVSSWIASHFRNFNLPVVDTNKNQRLCNCSLYERPKNLDAFESSKRMFHTIISYRIWVELDEENRYNKPIVTSTDIKSGETRK